MGKEDSFESSCNVGGVGDFMTIFGYLMGLWGRLIFCCLVSGVG